MPPGVASRRRTGWICLLLGLALFAVALPLRVAGRAALVGGVSAGAGFALGACLAGITRTRRPVLIYGLLFLALAMLVPLALSWPPASMDEIFLPPGAPSILENYFDVLRFASFALALPYPFARFGHHAPDPLPSSAPPPDSPTS